MGYNRAILAYHGFVTTGGWSWQSNSLLWCETRTRIFARQTAIARKLARNEYADARHIAVCGVQIYSSMWTHIAHGGRRCGCSWFNTERCLKRHPKWRWVLNLFVRLSSLRLITKTHTRGHVSRLTIDSRQFFWDIGPVVIFHPQWPIETSCSLGIIIPELAFFSHAFTCKQQFFMFEPWFADIQSRHDILQ